MSNVLTTDIADAAAEAATRVLELAGSAPKASSATACYHCGTPVRGARHALGEKSFCCAGCRAVFELLTAGGLTDFYRLGWAAGVRVKTSPAALALQYLDDPSVRRRLVDYADDRTTHVTFRVPAMHCIACVWLLENLFRLNPGIGRSRVNFPRKEVSLTFENSRVTLAGVVALLTRLRYEPDLKLSDLEERSRKRVSRRLWLQLGVAGFAFGNIMLLSISSYFGLDAFSGPGLKKLFGLLSFALALPVLLYSASDYWRAAWLAWRRRQLTIEVPIAVGIVALAARSTVEVFAGRGAGYFDSLAGLVFFLLCGKWFQQKTYDRLAFDRDYKSFFPLAVTRKSEHEEEQVALSQLRVGDRLAIRNGEIIPADSVLQSGSTTVDYSFVTGESEPVAKIAGDHLFAGGRLIGPAVEIETVKAVSQSYLASLWNQQAFQNKQAPQLDTLTNRYSRRFTKIVIAIALGAAAFWGFRDPARSLPSFTAVLIVACPCALALAAPFSVGAAQRVLARRNIFLKNASIIESLARVNAVVFDKTGTLTACGAGRVEFWGEPLGEAERKWGQCMAKASHHPAAVRIADDLAAARTAKEEAGRIAEDLAAARTAEKAAVRIAEDLAAARTAEKAAVRIAEDLAAARTAKEEAGRIAEDLAAARTAEKAAVRIAEDLAAARTAEKGAVQIAEDAAARTAEKEAGRTAKGEAGRIDEEADGWRGEVAEGEWLPAVRSFSETPGCGMEGVVEGREILMGSAAWLTSRGVAVPALEGVTGTTVYLAIDGVYRGVYVLTSALRPRTETLLRRLGTRCELALLSGDNEKERERFTGLFPSARLHFNQSPLHKLEFIRNLEAPGRCVMMVGDGLNDAGALQQSDVGVAVVENIGAFSPASDVIMSAKMVTSLHEVLHFARSTIGIVRLSIAISAVYNVIGISLAACGMLSPVVCAILMPISSVSVVVFACAATGWAGRGIGAGANGEEARP